MMGRKIVEQEMLVEQLSYEVEEWMKAAHVEREKKLALVREFVVENPQTDFPRYVAGSVMIAWMLFVVEHSRMEQAYPYVFNHGYSLCWLWICDVACELAVLAYLLQSEAMLDRDRRTEFLVHLRLLASRVARFFVQRTKLRLVRIAAMFVVMTIVKM